MEKNQRRKKKKDKEEKEKRKEEHLTKTHNIKGNIMEKLFLPVTVTGTSLQDAQPVVSATGNRLSPAGTVLTELQKE